MRAKNVSLFCGSSRVTDKRTKELSMPGANVVVVIHLPSEWFINCEHRDSENNLFHSIHYPFVRFRSVVAISPRYISHRGEMEEKTRDFFPTLKGLSKWSKLTKHAKTLLRSRRFTKRGALYPLPPPLRSSLSTALTNKRSV